MTCKICNRKIKENGYCSLHLKAYQNIMDKFEVWNNASGTLWLDYLVEIQKNSLTGEWAKDVAKQLLEDESRHVK
jgi:hypothetical protein